MRLAESNRNACLSVQYVSTRGIRAGWKVNGAIFSDCAGCLMHPENGMDAPSRCHWPGGYSILHRGKSILIMFACLNQQVAVRFLFLASGAAAFFLLNGCESSPNRTQYQRHLETVISQVSDDRRGGVLLVFGRGQKEAIPSQTVFGGSTSANLDQNRPSLHAEAFSAYDRGLPPPPMP